MGYGSTIRQKKGQCQYPGCNYYGPVTKGKCPTHYWSGIRMNSAAKLEEKEQRGDKGLSTVMDDLDAVFSQFIRLRDSDDNGYVTCYCCGAVHFWKVSQCMHFVPRIHQATRYSEENCHGGCSECNEHKKGNLGAYGAHLEADRPGAVEILEEQGRSTYSYSISELKGLISHYWKEVRRFLKIKHIDNV